MCSVCESAAQVSEAADALTAACMARLDAKPSKVRPQLRRAYPVDPETGLSDLITKLNGVKR